MRRAEVLAVCGMVAAWGAAGAPPIWTGVYTGAQAARGQATYGAACGRCHRDDMSGAGGVLIGNKFMSQWREDSVGSFYKTLRQTMPANAPGSLSEKEYLDIVAYVLQMNEFPAGDKELTADALGAIRIEGKEGAAPVPDFSLVTVVGCLRQKADGAWFVDQASEPVRTRVPGDSPAEELPGLRAKAFGTHVFGLLDFAGVQNHPVKDMKVEAKGLLIRKAGDDRLNPSSLQMLGVGCGQ